DGSFRPDRPVTREEFMTLFGRALLFRGIESGILPFADRDQISAWALPYVREALQKQWIQGYAGGEFRANAQLSRQEMAVILARSMEDGLPGAREVLSAFADHQLIGPWAADGAALLVEAGILQGGADRLLRPLE